MTHEELLQKMSDIAHKKDAHEARNDYLLALLAVVKLHQPIYTFVAGSDKSIPLCIQCRDGDFIADYPCPTIQDIEKELG